MTTKRDCEWLLRRRFCAVNLSREAFGELIGGSSKVSRLMLRAHLLRFDFTNLEVDVALRLFLKSFRLPGESQVIDRIMEQFAARFNHCNVGKFAHPDTAYVLAYSIVMLSTDAHSRHVRKKMTKDEWLRNNSGIDDGADLPRAMLETMYQRIVSDPFRVDELGAQRPNSGTAIAAAVTATAAAGAAAAATTVPEATAAATTIVPEAGAATYQKQQQYQQQQGQQQQRQAVSPPLRLMQ